MEVVYARSLNHGDLVDLSRDPFADPEGDVQFQVEYAEVDSVEQGTDECVVVHFVNHPSMGFPTKHFLKRYYNAMEHGNERIRT